MGTNEKEAKIALEVRLVITTDEQILWKSYSTETDALLEADALKWMDETWFAGSLGKREVKKLLANRARVNLEELKRLGFHGQPC